ncbi:MAG: CBS domain-containing protein [Actinomycetota bacterium]
MKISDILRHKGTEVVTIGSGEPIRGVLALLAEHNVGALVVVDDDDVVGIVSERDIVRKLHERGDEVLQDSASGLMTAPILSCAPHDPVETIAATMTDNRIRHMPVLNDGRLAGIVTIGDVVAGQIRQLAQDRDQLENYITKG